jgi:carboxyl-terminal processing protease
MRGEPNTKVLLTILRKSEDRSFAVTIVREEIKTQSVKSKLIEPDYGWIRASQFQDRTVDDFTRQLENMARTNPRLKGLVLDLRGNPGGLLEASVAMSAVFLPANVTVVSTNGQLADSKSIYKASPEFYAHRRNDDPVERLHQNTRGIYKTIPLVVLVNEGSASASEIVAGALQDHERATLMGNQTFGKGSVQTVRALGPDTGLKLTTARYYTPKGRSIQAKGIVPDILVDETEQGNVLAGLRTREADLQKHLSDGTTPTPMTDAQRATEQARENEREQTRQRLEEEARKNPGQRLVPEFGSEQDFQLQQALNHLKRQPVITSKTLTVRPEESKAP